MQLSVEFWEEPVPNNREWALLFWVLVLIAWAMYRKDMRSSLRQVLQTAATLKILIPLTGLLAWTAGLALAGSRIGLWEPSLTSGTVLWWLTTGVVLLFNLNKVTTEQNYFRRKALATLEFGVLVQAYSELFVLSLAAEVVLQPLFAFLGALSVVAAQRNEHKPVKRIVDAIIVIGSVLILAFVTNRLIEEWASIEKGGLLAQLGLPIWLTIGVLPFIYLVGTYAAYEMAFTRIDLRSEGTWRDRMRSRLILLLSFHVKARELGRFSGPWQFRLAEAGSFSEAREVVREFHRAERERLHEAQEAERRLERYAGHPGVDEDGRRLDRREFEETTSALRWLATCQMGWHRNHGGRYREELLQVLDDDFTRQGLPKPSGIVMEVSEAGDSWFAWRRTISGWVFAVGAAGPPPNQWEYDGPEPPPGFPGADPSWGSSPFSVDANRNW